MMLLLTQIFSYVSLNLYNLLSTYPGQFKPAATNPFPLIIQDLLGLLLISKLFSVLLPTSIFRVFVIFSYFVSLEAAWLSI